MSAFKPWKQALAHPITQAMLFLAMVIAVSGEGLAFWLNAQKAQVEQEIARNAPQKAKFDAALAKAKAAVQAQVAANAEALKKGEADLAGAQATVEQAQAKVAELERTSVANREGAEARMKQALALVAEQKYRLEADIAEMKQQISQIGFSEGGHAAFMFNRTLAEGLLATSSRRAGGWPADTNRVPPKCRDLWRRFVHQKAFGAFAIGKDWNCAMQTGAGSVDEAKAAVIQQCDQHYIPNCAVAQVLVPPLSLPTIPR